MILVGVFPQITSTGIVHLSGYPPSSSFRRSRGLDSEHLLLDDLTFLQLGFFFVCTDIKFLLQIWGVEFGSDWLQEGS